MNRRNLFKTLGLGAVAATFEATGFPLAAEPARIELQPWTDGEKAFVILRRRPSDLRKCFGDTAFLRKDGTVSTRGDSGGRVVGVFANEAKPGGPAVVQIMGPTPMPRSRILNYDTVISDARIP